MRLKPRVKEMYLAALRSGEYQQCRKWMRIGNCFCAVGVLCDLYAKETKNTDWLKYDSVYDSGDDIFGIRYLNHTYAAGLSPDVARWAFVLESQRDKDDISLFDGIPVRELETTIARMNDEGYTLSEIADTVEVYL